MGSMMSYTAPHLWKENTPNSHAPIKYDPSFGFTKQRKIREMHVTEEEMNSVGLEDEERDYCAHVRVKAYGCLQHENPLFYRCNGIIHELSECVFEDYQHNMKEFERERRLMERESRIKRKQSS